MYRILTAGVAMYMIWAGFDTFHIQAHTMRIPAKSIAKMIEVSKLHKPVVKMPAYVKHIAAKEI